MRRHVHPGNHAAESFVSFIPLFGGAVALASHSPGSPEGHDEVAPTAAGYEEAPLLRQWIVISACSTERRRGLQTPTSTGGTAPNRSARMDWTTAMRFRSRWQPPKHLLRETGPTGLRTAITRGVLRMSLGGRYTCLSSHDIVSTDGDPPRARCMELESASGHPFTATVLGSYLWAKLQQEEVADATGRPKRLANKRTQL